MKKHSSDITYAVTPEVLAAKGGIVDLKIDITFPGHYFNKSTRIEATPVLRFNGGEKSFEMKELQGEKVIGNMEVIPYNEGKTVTYISRIPYEDVMRLSSLEIDLVGFKGSKSLAFGPRKIGNGIIATAALVENKPLLSLGADEFQRVTKQQKEAAIYYLINSAEIRNREMTSKEIKELEAFIKEALLSKNTALGSIDVKSYASPDGPLGLNEKLAGNRETGSTAFLKNQLKTKKILPTLPASLLNQHVVPEDWEGFQKAMEESNIQDKELILRVLSMYSDPEVREREIKNIASAFTTVAEQVLPKLRRSLFVVNTEQTGKSDEELKSLAQKNPGELNAEELLYAATLFEREGDKLSIYRAITRLYSNDWRGYNDVGTILLEQCEIAEAKASFNRAAALSPNNKVILNNLGAVALKEGNLQQASVHLGNATGAGAEVEYNKGILSIINGDYNAAVRYLGAYNDVNAALANILVGNYNEATRKLNTDNSALGFYLKAVIGARQNNSAMVLDNLKKATTIKLSYKQLAATDAEFVRYFENPEFAAIVK
ncbi:MAG: hypothetical protein LBD64_02160 [Odoribacteraceae bacterium]|nr:hypothetical protein [Odoribacteraceae bacterium]